ncbi:MAG TPA: hypothetical protein VFV38_01825 [Ktedonobacteraceae bacterium]|nr:hypothetical protein [Ktedonobacteraceae bacterium]
MSAHRELKNGETDTSELDAHLEECMACRETLASYAQIGEAMRATPMCSPPPEMHARLMRALADEQLKILQKSAPGKAPTPEFLKPYLQERAHATQRQDDIAAFSTAETGPLPMLQTRRKRRPLHMNQFTVLGMAAAILILVMTGGLTSLLMLARSNPTSITTTGISLHQPSEVFQKAYTTDTLYSNITSAVPVGNAVYYSASGNGANSNSWMLMQFDRNTQLSKPLLETASSSPLIILSASNSWLVWLEYARPQPTTHGDWASADKHHSPQRTWSLHYLSLLPQQPTNTNQSSNQGATTGQTSDNSPMQKGKLTKPTEQADFSNTTTLTQGIFDSMTAPGWATTPIQGTSLHGDTLLVAQIDQKGISHLENYHLDQVSKSTSGQVIATAPPGHILSWPTTNSDGTQTYWSDEWIAANGILHSNIWQQETFEQTVRYRGHVEERTFNTQQLFLADGMSFQPQIVNNTLLFLSTSEVTVSDQGEVRPNGISLPLSATDADVQFIPRTDPNIYAAPIDASIHGTLFMIPLDGIAVGTESMLGTVGQTTSFQAGSNYVIWRDNAGYQMYDVQHQSNVVVGTMLNNADLLMVNGNTTLWWSNNDTGTTQGKLSLLAFNWPG